VRTPEFELKETQVISAGKVYITVLQAMTNPLTGYTPILTSQVKEKFKATYDMSVYAVSKVMSIAAGAVFIDCKDKPGASGSLGDISRTEYYRKEAITDSVTHVTVGLWIEQACGIAFTLVASKQSQLYL